MKVTKAKTKIKTKRITPTHVIRDDHARGAGGEAKRDACAGGEGRNVLAAHWKKQAEEWYVLAEKRRTTMDFCEGVLFKALRVRYTRAELASIILCTAHALSEDPVEGNPKLLVPKAPERTTSG